VAATVEIHRHTGPGGGRTRTNITSATTRASTSDAAAPGTADPVPIPAAGTNYAFWISTKLRVTGGAYATVSNIRWFSDGTNNFGTGVTCLGAVANTNGANSEADGYYQAQGSQGVNGTELTQGNHDGLDEAPANVFGYNSGSPKTVDSGSTASGGEPKDVGKFFVFQVQVASTATAGTIPAETFSWRYDET